MMRLFKILALCNLFYLGLFSQVFGQESKRVSGIVSDSSGPLANVTVSAAGEASTKTLNNGTYSINVKNKTRLKYSLFGYRDTIVSADQDVINVILTKESKDIDDVVIIGYGRVQKQDLTGSVSQVNMAAIADIPVAGVEQKLTGQIAGVQIKTPTGIPGGGSTMKIRGSGSIGAGDDPLFVIDGFPISGSSGRTSNPLSLISPDDIEYITVLKDASSTAIYGSRGANGVVIITTKRGKSGAPRLDLSAYTGVASLPKKGRPNLLNGGEFAQFRKEIIEDDFRMRGLIASEQDIPIEFRNPSQYGVGTDWYDIMFRNAAQNSINGNVTGGGDKSRYAISLGYISQDGVLDYTGFDRFTARANFESQLSERFKFGFNMAPTYSKQLMNDFETSFVDVVTASLWYSPIIPAYDENGNRTPYIGSPGMYSGPHPLNKLEYGVNNQRNFRGLGSTFLEMKVIDGLKLKYTYSADFAVNRGKVFNPAFVGAINTPPANMVANAGHGNGWSYNWLSEVLLNYDKTFNEKNRIDVVAGFSAQKERGESLNISATNFPDDLVQTINAASTIGGWAENIQEWALLSYFARANYIYDNKWILTATVRRDGSSRFGMDKKYGTFPSGAVAYRISEETFLKDISWLDELKIRSSYGLSGNFNIGNYAFASTIGTANYSFGGVLAGGRVSSSLANPNLTWEESAQFDLGLDLNVFSNRINLTLDYYTRNTKGMLYNAEIPWSSGYSSALINSGKIRNSGFEISLNTVNVDKEFKWSSNFNIAFNRNKVISLNENNDPIYSGRSGEGHSTHLTQVGSPIGLFFGYVNQGVYMTQADFDNSPKHVTSVLGSIKYKDVNGDGIIEPINDFDVIGNPNPDFIFGFTNTFNYKGFDLSVLLTGSYGNDILKQANQYLNNIDGIFNVDRSVLDRWRSEDNPGNGKIPTTNGARVIYRDVNSSWVEDGSYLRIQNLTLGYRLPKNWIKSVSSIRIYASAQNLATFTKYSGGNPDVVPRSNEIGGSLALVPGLDYTSYPLPRTFVFGLNVNF